MMDVKEFLQEVRRQGAKVKTTEESLNRLYYEATHLSSPILGDKVQTSHQPSLDDVLIRIEKARDDYFARYVRLLDMQREAERIISSERDPIRYTVLHRRYILRERWEKIAAELHYSIQHIFRLHEEALNDIKNIRVNESFFCGNI